MVQAQWPVKSQATYAATNLLALQEYQSLLGSSRQHQSGVHTKNNDIIEPATAAIISAETASAGGLQGWRRRVCTAKKGLVV